MKTVVKLIHLDALILPHDTVVKDALADYSRLPHTDTIQDYNPDTPYVGESILNQPFQDKNLMLKSGVHLHWSLPTGLTKTIGFPIIKKGELHKLNNYFEENTAENLIEVRDQIWNDLLVATNWIKLIGENSGSILSFTNIDQDIFHSGVNSLTITHNWTLEHSKAFVKALVKLMTKLQDSDYATVPDVWVVNRKVNDKITRTWVVESNYISTTRSPEQGNLGAVNVPFYDDKHDNKTQPYRYMGRQLDNVSTWTSASLKGENYLHEITAVGYNPQPRTKGLGEPTFAAFYPNCMSVFGLYDNEITASQPGLVYEVMGLYGRPENDYLNIFIKDFANRNPKGDDYFQDLNAALKSEFLWETPKDFQIDYEVQSVLFGKAIPKVAQKPNPTQIDITVGNTGTEALSAYLSTKLDGDKKNNEEILESIQLASKLQNKVLDIGHKFIEARHEKGFTAFPGGTLWTIKLETEEALSAKDSNNSDIREMTLPDDLASLLNQINSLQFDYDNKEREVQFLRRQLFSDWYKYMVSAYPPVDNKTIFFNNDEILEYLRKDSIPSLESKLDSIGLMSITNDDNGRLASAATNASENSIAGQLTLKLQQLAEKVKALNNEQDENGKSLKDKGKCMAIRQTAAPRYWRANDPVVLFSEKPTASQTPTLFSERHATPGTSEIVEHLVVDIVLTQPDNFSVADVTKIFLAISSIFKDQNETGTDKASTIWNPFMMEWEVEFLPTILGNNETSETRMYDQNYIDTHYVLKETDPDFSLKSATDIPDNASLYSGSTILTPSAGVSLDRSIEQFVKNFGDSQTPEMLIKLENAQEFLKKTNVLSQSIGGFHEGLVMQKQTRQLDIADPLGFPQYQDFAENEVAPLVEKYNLTAPQPLGNFNPIRSGEFKILNLRLIDAFGQTLDFNEPGVLTSETLAGSSQTSSVILKPRLSQPARLNFRLLSGSSGEQEMNTHPASSPICGWLLPNNLDRSIMFYDHDGCAIGALTMNTGNPWMPAPDSNKTSFIDSIANFALRKVARNLFDRQSESIKALGTSDNSFLHHFISALDNAIENIDPENFAEHQDIAVLMGKPIAVVRAKLNLELEGCPATDQSWTQFGHELQGHGRSSDAFIKVKFPIRLGEYKQLNDGLIGYWQEDSEGQLDDYYISSEAGENPDSFIKTYTPGGQPLNIYQSIDDDPVCVTMLADPKGIIHVASGILPVKSVSIPKDQYKDALKNIAITFLTAPILSTENHLKLSVPKEPGYEWNWLEQRAERKWLEIAQTVIIQKQLFDSKFTDEPTLWNQLVSKNWLELINGDSERAMITSAVHRSFPPNDEVDHDPFPIEIGKRLDDFFDNYGKRIEPFDLHVSFTGAQVLREGWLQLATEQNNNNDNSNPEEDGGA